ncbi:MAG TPA: GNAT family N-acetyltransferase, partial [Dermatophilaceae bacterium]|nr:GNAT family N-acetyltransferase [Dermatophilaceae bacterium]
MIELRRPDASLHREWLDFVSDYDRPGVDGGSVRDDELAGLADPGVFAAWVAQLRDQEAGRNIAPDRVPCTSRWIVREGEIVGVINLRHELNDLLLAWGGHIGYAVRTSARRQGIATRALALMLGEAARLGINPVLVTCDEDNVGSRRTIEGAGGVYDGSVEGKRRNWITLADTPIGYA